MIYIDNFWQIIIRVKYYANARRLIRSFENLCREVVTEVPEARVGTSTKSATGFGNSRLLLQTQHAIRRGKPHWLTE